MGPVWSFSTGPQPSKRRGVVIGIAARPDGGGIIPDFDRRAGQRPLFEDASSRAPSPLWRSRCVQQEPVREELGGREPEPGRAVGACSGRAAA